MPAITSSSQAIPVREVLGTSRAFVLIRDQAGRLIGHGEFGQTTHGSQVSSVLSLHFRDGSLDEETSRFSQGRSFRLVNDHHVQRGPMFPKSLDMMVDAGGHVSVVTQENGKETTESSQVSVTPNTVNGLIGAAIVNLPKSFAEQKFDYVAPVGKGRMIRLKVTPERRDKFSIADTSVSAEVYRIHYELGGVTGLIAPMIGKQPDDTLVWVTSGVPSLIREQTALYNGGPIISIELAGATFASIDAEQKQQEKKAAQ